MVLCVRNEESRVFLKRGGGLKMTSMFDIYTIQEDGTPLLIESVERQSIARETAYYLSLLFPGESFTYVDRTGKCLSYSSLWNEFDRLSFSRELPQLC